MSMTKTFDTLEQAQVRVYRKYKHYATVAPAMGCTIQIIQDEKGAGANDTLHNASAKRAVITKTQTKNPSRWDELSEVSIAVVLLRSASMIIRAALDFAVASTVLVGWFGCLGTSTGYDVAVTVPWTTVIISYSTTLPMFQSWFNHTHQAQV